MKTLSWTVADMGDQRDLTVLITGANSGLGLSSARAFAQSGARVLLGCRSPERGGAALKQVQAVATGEAPQLIEVDLADLQSVQRASEQVGESIDRLDVLMNNAGVMALPLRRTAQGHEMQFGTNHLGHFALTARLLPLLLSAPEARVVTTSSGAHRLGKMRWQDLDWHNGYHKWAAYGQSKLANLMFCFELQRQADAAKAQLSSLALRLDSPASSWPRTFWPSAHGSPDGCCKQRLCAISRPRCVTPAVCSNEPRRSWRLLLRTKRSWRDAWRALFSAANILGAEERRVETVMVSFF